MAASMVSDGWIDEFCSGTNEEINVSNISKAIEQGELEFHVFVEKLGPFLASPELILRQMGTNLFVRVLQQLPRDLFKESQVELIIEFLSQRMKEQHSIIPHVLQGVLAVSAYKHLPNGSVQKLLQAMFQALYIPSLLQPERICIYTTFANFIQYHMEDLQGLGTEFVMGFIQVLDGERDPRCLIMAFTIAPLIIQNFNLGALDEEFFEVVSCYFPVDFTPSPSDSQLITKSDIAEMLKKCLLATPKFAKFCLPLLLEKLDSDILSAKLDSLEVLVESCSSYGVDELKPFLSSIWTAIRKELLSAKSEKLEEYCIMAIKSLVEISSTAITETGEHSVLDDFLSEIWKDCKPLLCQPEQKLIHPTAKLLCTVAYVSSPAYYFIFSRVVPLLLDQVHKVQQDSEKRNLLQVLCAFLCVNNGVFGAGHNNSDGDPLVVHRETLLSLLFSLLTHSDQFLLQTSLKAISKLIPRHGYFLERHQNLMADHLISFVNSGKAEDVCDSLQELCTVFSLSHPIVVQRSVIPALCEKLDTFPATEDPNEEDTLSACLVYLISLVTDEGTMKPVIAKLTKCLTDSTSEKRITLFLESLASISKKPKPSAACLLYETCTSHVIKSCLEAAYASTSPKAAIWLLPAVIEGCSKLIQSVVVDLHIGSTDELSSNLVELIVYNKSSPLLSGDIQPPLFQSPNEKQQLMLMTLLRSVLAHVSKDVSFNHFPDLVQWLTDRALECPESVTIPASQTVAALINKTNAVAEEGFVGTIRQRLKGILNDDSSSVICRRKAVILTTWITKALLLKGDPLVDGFISQLVESLGNEDIGLLTANGFLTVVQESSEVLGASSHSNVRLLYPQKFFMKTSNQILQGYKSTTNENVQKNFLCALSHQLKFQHRSVLLQELPPLLPIIVESLQAEDPQLIVTLLRSIHDLLAESPALFESHLEPLLSALLNLSCFKSSMEVRLAALQCIELLTFLPMLLLIPHRKNTVTCLKKCLDDHKRLVRRQAAAARLKWFLLGDSVPPDEK